MVVMLKIHTNFFEKGYGPHGLGGQVDDLHDFSSPLSTDGPIVGIFGRKSNYLESLGVITRSKVSRFARFINFKQWKWYHLSASTFVFNINTLKILHY